MRKIFTLIFLTLCTIAFAQQKRLYLFPDFVKTKIFYKAGAKFMIMANYDAANKKVMYYQNQELMELVSPELVDTIFFDNQKWVYHNKQFCQVVKRDNHEILIGWNITKVHDGYVGVYGISQVPSQRVELGDHFGMGGIAGAGGGMYNGSFGVNDKNGGRNMDVWSNKNQNTYYFTRKGKECKVNNLKSIYKAFPEHTDKIKECVGSNKTIMMEARQALALIEFCLSLDN